MKRSVYFVAVAALAASFEALAVGSITQIEIIDRRSGVELMPYYCNGEYWVAGTPGAIYAIQIHNRLGERVLVVTAVDGVNVISGATAAWNQTGYVFNPNEGYEITGWRKSDSEVAAFTFTASPNSYAERTGRPANIGIIGVAIFRERQPQPVYVPPVIKQSQDPPGVAHEPQERRAPPSRSKAAGSSVAEVTVVADRRSAASVPMAPIAAGALNSTEPPELPAGSRSAIPTDAPIAPAPPPPAPPVQAAAPKLGTGHGERQFSYVTHTDFTRMQSEPNEVIRIRYDSFENLVAMGIVERPHPAIPAADAFPDSPEQRYVPDPPGRNAGQLR